jgi:hypothetical protein
MLEVTQKWIKQRLASGQFKISVHASIRMQERFVLEADIKSCGATARKIEYQADLKTWKVIGKDLDGEKITVICSVKNQLLIVTVF